MLFITFGRCIPSVHAVTEQNNSHRNILFINHKTLMHLPLALNTNIGQSGRSKHVDPDERISYINRRYIESLATTGILIMQSFAWPYWSIAQQLYLVLLSLAITSVHAIQIPSIYMVYYCCQGEET